MKYMSKGWRLSEDETRWGKAHVDMYGMGTRRLYLTAGDDLWRIAVLAMEIGRIRTGDADGVRLMPADRGYQEIFGADCCLCYALDVSCLHRHGSRSTTIRDYAVSHDRVRLYFIESLYYHS